MNRWNTIRRCLVAGVVAVGLLVVPQAALAIAGHCCLTVGGCENFPPGENCGTAECYGVCGPYPCGDPRVHCWWPAASEEPDGGTGNEAVSSASESDGARGEAKTESGTEKTLSSGAVGPESTDAALVDPAAEMDLDMGVSIGDPLKELASVTPPNAPGIKECANICNSPAQGCARLSCDPCCWLCGGYEICILPPPPGP